MGRFQELHGPFLEQPEIGPPDIRPCSFYFLIFLQDKDIFITVELIISCVLWPQLTNSSQFQVLDCTVL